MVCDESMLVVFLRGMMVRPQIFTCERGEHHILRLTFESSSEESQMVAEHGQRYSRAKVFRKQLRLIQS